MMVQVCNPSTGEAEAGGSQVQVQSGLYSETLSQTKQTKKTWWWMVEEGAGNFSDKGGLEFTDGLSVRNSRSGSRTFGNNFLSLEIEARSSCLCAHSQFLTK
jgi:hypothetical protein